MIPVCQREQESVRRHDDGLNILTLELSQRALKIVELFDFGGPHLNPVQLGCRSNLLFETRHGATGRIGKKSDFRGARDRIERQLYKLTDHLLDVGRNAGNATSWMRKACGKARDETIAERWTHDRQRWRYAIHRSRGAYRTGQDDVRLQLPQFPRQARERVGTSIREAVINVYGSTLHIAEAL
jgi:hypothetical protein